MFSADYKSLDLPNIYKIEKETYFFFHNYFEGIWKLVSSHAPQQKDRKRKLRFQLRATYLINIGNV